MNRRLFVLLTAFLVALALYPVPLLLELALLPTHAGVCVTCVILVDLPGAIVVYAMGFRKIAFATYADATCLEESLL